ncbi:MAG: FkbM family methyltransferase [Candidatus Woesebacteria bacterium]
MQTTYRGLTIHYRDQLEMDTLLEEEFKKNQYYVDLPTNTPLIIDGGAHIGTSTLYLHSLYPHARFICIEPDPANIELLSKNLEENDIDQATIISKALVGADSLPSVKLFTNHTFTVLSSLKVGGWTGEDKLEAIDVETIRLSEIITEPVDLLKLDIEGMETVVIEEAQSKLSLVKNLILEFHKTKTHSEEKILRILKNHFKTVNVIRDSRKERNKNNLLLMIEATK